MLYFFREFDNSDAVAKNRRSPLIMTQAKVLDKHVQIQNIRRKRSSRPGYVKHKMYIYYVLFEIEGGDTLEFQVKKGEYMKIKKGGCNKIG